MGSNEKMLEEDREKMRAIAKPFFLDCCADPFSKETAMTLLNRIENKKSEVGKLILDCMALAFEEGRLEEKEG
jgi:hypothetical protein